MKYTLFILIIFFIACKNNTQKLLPQELYQVQAGYNDQDSSGYESAVLRLYNDSTYCHYAVNFYNFGKWKWNEKSAQITLIAQQGYPLTEKFIFQLTATTGNNFLVRRIRKRDGYFLRDKKEELFKGNNNRSKEDPFSFTNNQWRIKPTVIETQAQLKTRTRNYLHFLKTYYQHAIDNNFETIINGWYPEPLQLNYGNGVRMSYSNELTNWYGCFYNEEQGNDAYKLISGTMRKITVHKKDTYAERNIDLIEQIEKLIQ